MLESMFLLTHFRKAFALIVLKGSHDPTKKQLEMRMPTGNTHPSIISEMRTSM